MILHRLGHILIRPPFLLRPIQVDHELQELLEESGSTVTGEFENGLLGIIFDHEVSYLIQQDEPLAVPDKWMNDAVCGSVQLAPRVDCVVSSRSPLSTIILSDE